MNKKPKTLNGEAGRLLGAAPLLGDISEDELDHLSKGLELNFGAQIWRPKGMCGLVILETEDGTRHGISPACTVGDVWRIAEVSWESGDPVPPKVDGVRNILASPNEKALRSALTADVERKERDGKT